MLHDTVSYTPAAVLAISHNRLEPINHQGSLIQEPWGVFLLVIVSRGHHNGQGHIRFNIHSQVGLVSQVIGLTISAYSALRVR